MILPRISVVFPIYGQFNLARALLSVQSTLAQRDINLEVIISEQGEHPRFPAIEGVRHTFSYHRPLSNLSDFNPGNVRNIGISQSTGEFVYTNDADILFINPHYLAIMIGILSKDSSKVFYRPKMRRLPLDNFEKFEKITREIGVTKAISRLDFFQEYLVTIDGTTRRIKVTKKDTIYQKIFTAFEEDFKLYIVDKTLRGKEPLIWCENRHCGGNLFRREQFDTVGGYSEEFINWGCEDSDLQWKFSQLYDLQFFPEGLEVIHMDHPKNYFNPEMWKQNEAISERRVKNGVDEAIKIDRRNRLWHPK